MPDIGISRLSLDVFISFLVCRTMSLLTSDLLLARTTENFCSTFSTLGKIYFRFVRLVIISSVQPVRLLCLHASAICGKL
jgi:hypothetical protein